MDEAALAPPGRATPYRRAVLAAFLAVDLTIQVLWISYAPIENRKASHE